MGSSQGRRTLPPVMRRLVEPAGGARAESVGSESGQMDPSRFNCDKKKETQMAGPRTPAPGRSEPRRRPEPGLALVINQEPPLAVGQQPAFYTEHNLLDLGNLLRQLAEALWRHFARGNRNRGG